MIKITDTNTELSGMANELLVEITKGVKEVAKAVAEELGVEPTQIENKFLQHYNLID